MTDITTIYTKADPEKVKVLKDRRANGLERFRKSSGWKESKAYAKGLHFLDKSIPPSDDMRDIPGGDHVTYWNKDGVPYCIVSQPYQLTTQDLLRCADMLRVYNLDLVISSTLTWHNPGRVISMIWKRRESN